MTFEFGDFNILSPVAGDGNEGPLFLPDILVNVCRFYEDNGPVGVIREVLPDGFFRVALGSSGNGETVVAYYNEIVLVVPKKVDRIKILSGRLRGATGKLIGIDGNDGVVKIADTLEVTIVDMDVLGKLAQH